MFYQEKSADSYSIKSQNQKVSLNSTKEGRVVHHFKFDKIFWPSSSQEDVFNNSTLHCIDHVLNGFNASIFAFGQTGSGKTYTIFGEGSDKRGIIARSVEYLFPALVKRSEDKEIAVVVTFLELYCDQIRDLGRAFVNKDTAQDGASRQTTTQW